MYKYRLITTTQYYYFMRSDLDVKSLFNQIEASNEVSCVNNFKYDEHQEEHAILKSSSIVAVEEYKVGGAY